MHSCPSPLFPLIRTPNWFAPSSNFIISLDLSHRFPNPTASAWCFSTSNFLAALFSGHVRGSSTFSARSKYSSNMLGSLLISFGHLSPCKTLFSGLNHTPALIRLVPPSPLPTRTVLAFPSTHLYSPVARPTSIQNLPRSHPENFSSGIAVRTLSGNSPGHRSRPRSRTQTLCLGEARERREAAMLPP